MGTLDVIKKITAMNARKNLGEVLEEVYYRGDQYVIERAGRPMAAIVPLAQLEAWQMQRDAFFATIDAVRKRNRKVSPKRIADEVTEAVQEARRSRQCAW
jgi:prevent-host-death family protein